MKRKGMNYDVGRVMMGENWRPVFNPAIVHRELEIIKNDLHCNAVRICGLNIDRLMTASEDALKQGLEVWLSPEMWDKSQEETLDYLVKAAAAAEKLRQRWPQLVFSLGSELTLFMQGIVEGNNLMERMEYLSSWENIRAGIHNKPLNAFLAEANEVIRQVFHGVFVFTFVSPTLTYSADPRYDLDMPSYSLVKSYADEHGTAYPDMPWEPKEAFKAVADYFAKQ